MKEFLKKLFEKHIHQNESDLAESSAEDLLVYASRRAIDDDYIYSSALSTNIEPGEMSYEDYMQIDKLYQKS